jgi:hypothetical protein
MWRRLLAMDATGAGDPIYDAHKAMFYSALLSLLCSKATRTSLQVKRRSLHA